MFPARAGMSPITVHNGGNRGGVPRASGDEPGVALPVPAEEACSPRERG